MPTKIYWIRQFDSGARLGIMPRPRGNDWLEEEIIHLKKQQVHVCVSLLEREEINELGLQKEEEFCLQNDIEYINFPIPDRDIPKNDRKAGTFLEQLNQHIQKGDSIVIHCRMGIGRSSIMAGALLLQAGFKTEQVIRQITAVRGLKVPDTDSQVQWLKNQEKTIRK